MSETPRNPYLAVDVVLVKNQQILLIERKNAPHGWALPGGFVDYGESVETAAVREAQEEVSLDVCLEALLGVYSKPSRDPRFHVTSVVFVASFEGEPKAADDAKNACFFPLENLPALAFDHAQIVEDYLFWKKTGKIPRPTL